MTVIYCQSCQAEIDSAADVCANCGLTLNPPPAVSGGTIVRPAARPKIQCKVELAATIDRTGSSERFAKGIPATYETIVSQISTKAREVVCWNASHGDKDYGQELVLLTDAGTPEQAINDVRTISYDGGGDPPEHHLDAIEELHGLVPWTADPATARGAIIAFLTADTKDATSGRSAREIGEQLKKDGVLLYLVCEPTPTLQELITAADGLMFQISNAPDPAELQTIAAQLAASIVATVSCGATVPMTVPIP